MNIIPIVPEGNSPILKGLSLELLADRDVEVLEPAFIARTSDRILFKRCRRLWGWMSVNGQGRKMRSEADYFWFGTGIHFALEDYHGINQYGHPALALKAYGVATSSVGRAPANYRELELLGMGLMSYYHEQFLQSRDPLQTLIWNDVPQVEVNARIDLGYRTDDGRRLLYGFTLDRVIEDEFGQLWIVEYKTAKSFRIYHFDTDDQITAYCWAAWRMYGKPVAGVIYQQHKKSLPLPPKILATGKISTDARQSTSAALYKDMLTQFYGVHTNWPNPNINLYNKLLLEEDEDKDRFIRRDKVERNIHQLQAFEAKLLMELEDMAREDLPLYPNPTKDCEWGCPLQAACVAMDRGDDWLHLLEAYTYAAKSVAEEQIKWRQLLPQSVHLNMPLEAVQYQQLVQRLQLQLEQESQQESSSSTTVSPSEAFLEELGM